VSVYYAEGTDGLATERETSVHAELIGLAGGRNVHKGEALDHMGMQKELSTIRHCSFQLNEPPRRWHGVRP